MGQLVKPHLDGLLPNTTNNNTNSNTTSNTRPPQLTERRAIRPQKEQALKCPRCNSTNTKFCYYNNYSLTQPRYFCKTCRRYWTEGGTLRNVPVGGGSRKNKRSNTTNTGGAAVAVAATTSSTKPISISTTYIAQNPKFHEGQDLNLAFPHYNLQPEFGHDFNNHNTNSGALSAMELLRYGISGRGLGSTFTPMMPEASGAYPSGFSLQDHLRAPTLSFPLDGIGGGGRGMLFPFEDLKQQVPSSTSTEQFEQNRVQGGDGSEVWNGIIGGGGSNW